MRAARGGPVALVTLLLAAGSGAAAPSSTVEAQRAVAARAKAAAREADRLVAERVTAAAALRGAESVTAAAAARVAELAARQREVDAALEVRARAFAPMLPVIERLSLYPAETLLAVPGPPEQTLRGVFVLAGLSRELEAEAAALRVERVEAGRLRAQVAAELPKLAAAEAEQARQAAALDQQIAAAQSARTAAEGEAAAAARKAAEEAARAETLRAAVVKLDADRQRKTREALARPPEAAEGRLTAPVAGAVVHGFGEDSDAGPSNGISYQVAPAAHVVSPCAGRVVFSGPFRSYGQLLIVDCGGGFHVVLAGLQRLDASVGQSVRQGEPVGVMPGWDPSGGQRRPTLYVELRQRGDPVNPAPFLRAKS